MNQTLKDDFLACRRVERRHGSSYFFATWFFTKDLQRAIWALYAFFRLPDEIVDHPELTEVDGLALPVATTPAERLREWRSWWQVACDGQVATHPVLRATAATFQRYGIDSELAEVFLTAMEQDTWKQRYATYDELREYMAGSAAAVGLMMMTVIGFDSPTAAPRAVALAEAMQLTNFIRDIGEDMRERGRIYIPMEDWQRFGVKESDFVEQRLTPAMIELLKFEIERARERYREAEPGINLLRRRGRLAVRLAARLYAKILDKVEENGYDVFSKRARTADWEKLVIAIKTLF